jgi:uncharacterized protein with PIN domain
MKPKKFICNGMLGTLCRLLRICGIDTTYTNQGLAILLEARKENRIILTRNNRLRTKESVYFVEDIEPIDQLGHIISAYSLQEEIEPFSRCIECNCLLKPVKKHAVKNKIPHYTYKHFNEFAVCPQCQRVYWKGSHYKNMEQSIRHLLLNAKE